VYRETEPVRTSDLLGFCEITAVSVGIATTGEEGLRTVTVTVVALERRPVPALEPAPAPLPPPLLLLALLALLNTVRVTLAMIFAFQTPVKVMSIAEEFIEAMLKMPEQSGLSVGTSCLQVQRKLSPAAAPYAFGRSLS
jgi:hypothetical protein